MYRVIMMMMTIMMFVMMRRMMMTMIIVMLIAVIMIVMVTMVLIMVTNDKRLGGDSISSWFQSNSSMALTINYTAHTPHSQPHSPRNTLFFNFNWILNHRPAFFFLYILNLWRISVAVCTTMNDLFLLLQPNLWLLHCVNECSYVARYWQDFEVWGSLIDLHCEEKTYSFTWEGVLYAENTVKVATWNLCPVAIIEILCIELSHVFKICVVLMALLGNGHRGCHQFYFYAGVLTRNHFICSCCSNEPVAAIFHSAFSILSAGAWSYFN